MTTKQTKIQTLDPQKQENQHTSKMSAMPAGKAKVHPGLALKDA